MTRALFITCASPALLLCTLLGFGACSSDQKPSSLISGGGGANSVASGGHGGKGELNAGAPSANAGGDDGAGTAGMSEGAGGASAEPLAIYPSALEADVGCNQETPSVALLIQNRGNEPLVISKASVSEGYTLGATLPLTIAPGASGSLSVTPPAASSDADAGAITSGKLSFTTNEPGTPTHEVTLNSATYEGRFEFTDSDGKPITSLSLVYDSGGACPVLTKYRIHNLGNATFTVLGPTFPSHFSGTTLGSSGHALAPGAYVELMAGAVSGNDDACQATGDLSFTVMGTFCGTVPKLRVVWPVSSDPDAGGVSCACTVPAL